jgi:hypothetical protein
MKVINVSMIKHFVDYDVLTEVSLFSGNYSFFFIHSITLKLGNCSEIENRTDIQCQCEAGWTGKYCEQLIDNCANVTCENKGVCINMLLDYICSCLSPHFSDRHCEIS